MPCSPSSPSLPLPRPCCADSHRSSSPRASPLCTTCTSCARRRCTPALVYHPLSTTHKRIFNCDHLIMHAMTRVRATAFRVWSIEVTKRINKWSAVRRHRNSFIGFLQCEETSPPPATATPEQSGCGHWKRPGQLFAAALRLRCRYWSSSSTVSSRGMSASRLQHHAAAPEGPSAASPAACSAACLLSHLPHFGSPLAWQMGHRMGYEQLLHNHTIHEIRANIHCQ